MVNTEEPEVKQIDINVKVGNESITAVVDCGANVDYVNEAWCKEKKFPITDIGKGWMEGFDGKQTKNQTSKNKIEVQISSKIPTTKVSDNQRNGHGSTSTRYALVAKD